MGIKEDSDSKAVGRRDEDDQMDLWVRDWIELGMK